MKEEVRIHRGYTEFKNAEEKGIKIPRLFGKYHYIFSTEKGRISLVLLKDYYYDDIDFWKIYCLEGNLFEDTERFDTKHEAIKRIKELLE